MTSGARDPTLDLRCRIPPQAHGTALLDYLLARFPYHDRTAWLTELAAGRLTVDGRTVGARHVLRQGERLTYHKVHREPAVDAGFVVVHDDPSVVVVRKPAHLPMHADGPFVRNTLIHLLRDHLQARDLHLVHRLDRETSGLCVLARSAATRDALRVQFAAGPVRKAYLALVRGLATGDFVVDLPVGRSAESAVSLRRACGPTAIAAKPARTSFHVLARGPERTLLRCEPITGRTHQIRVHLEAAGLPLLGDKLYGRSDADYLAFVAHVKAGGSALDAPIGEPGRQLLHASELAFDHPGSAERLEFSDPAPPEFSTWLTGRGPQQP